MRIYDRPADLIRRIASSGKGEAMWRDESRISAFTREKHDAKSVSRRGSDSNRETIFHGLIISGEKVAFRRRWASVASLAIQVLIVAVLTVYPMWHIAPLPKREWPITVHLESPPVAELSPKTIQAPKPMPAPVRAGIVLLPSIHIQQAAPPPAISANIELPLGALGGDVNGVAEGVLPGLGGAVRTSVIIKAPDQPPAKRIRVASGVAEANLIHDVPPVYPPEAGRKRVEGTVILLAVIGTDGAVKEVQVESGPSLLTQAAIDAVKQWRYKPYVLNGTSVEIDSRITINFTLSKG